MPTLSLFFPDSFPDKSVAGHTYRLEVPRPDSDSSEYTIGRGAEMEINLRVKTISRRHAVIGYSYAADTWSTQDLGSAGGTWLNDQRLPPYTWAKIQIGDKLRLGPNVALRIVEDDQDTIQGDDEPTFITPPKAPTPDPLPSLPTNGHYYDDALYLAVQWLTGGKSPWGKAARYLLVLASVALAVVLLFYLMES